MLFKNLLENRKPSPIEELMDFKDEFMKQQQDARAKSAQQRSKVEECLVTIINNVKGEKDESHTSTDSQ